VNHYRAYGLHIRSELELPELTPAGADSKIDVDILFGPVDGPLPTAKPRLVRFVGQSAYLAWPTIGRFNVSRHRSRITIEALTKDPQRIRFALLGPVLAALLQLRGTPLLHGSAVAANNMAIAFVGRKGAGKSTMAAACVAAGCGILNDDVLPLEPKTTRIMLVPGFPALKLDPSMHGELVHDLPLVGGLPQGSDDKIVVSDGTKSPSNLPIRAIVVLQADAPPDPVQLSPSMALRELLQNGYALKFSDAALANGQGPRLFEACARLASESQVLSVGHPKNRGQLRDFARTLLERCAEKPLVGIM
jgi:hypothetical protein